MIAKWIITGAVENNSEEHQPSLEVIPSILNQWQFYVTPNPVTGCQENVYVRNKHIWLRK